MLLMDKDLKVLKPQEFPLLDEEFDEIGASNAIDILEEIDISL